MTYHIETVAGNGRTGDGGPATAAQLSTIQGVAADHSGNLYFSDTDNQRVRKISSAGGEGMPAAGEPSSNAEARLERAKPLSALTA